MICCHYDSGNSASSEEDSVIAGYVLSCSQNTPLHSQPVMETHISPLLSKRLLSANQLEPTAKRSATLERALFSPSSDSECESQQSQQNQQNQWSQRNHATIPDSPSERRESPQNAWLRNEPDEGNVFVSQSLTLSSKHSRKVKSFFSLNM